MFFFNNLNVSLKEIDNLRPNDIESIKLKKVLINNETFSYYHLCKKYILFVNENKLNLIISFDVKKTLSKYNYFLKIYFIESNKIDKCNQTNCIDLLCDNNHHYNLNKSKLIHVIKKTIVTELINVFPHYIQDIKKCYECDNIWNFESEFRLIDSEKKYDIDKCDNCKMKQHIESKTLKSIGKCVICLNDIYKKNLTKTLCNHLFHKDCLDIWSKSNNKCPLCRKIIHNRYRIDDYNDNDSFILTI